MSAQSPIAEGLRALNEILERKRDRGEGYVSLLPESERSLQALPLALLQRAQEESAKRPAAPAAAPAPDASSDSAPAGAAVAGTVAEPISESFPAPERTEDWARKRLNEIFREVKQCEACRSLGTLRDTIVFASGNPLADLMFVGEAPGAEEEKQRRPFVGPAGKKLEQILGAMGMTRDDVYISNIVKFRPRKGDGRFQGTSNRKPDATEMAACIRFVREEIEVVAPKVIVALGGTAAEGLLERGDSISRMRGMEHEFAGVPVVVTYHPSYVLRQEGEGDPAKAKRAKRAVWEDMLRVMELLEMPITEKQRGYFL